MRKKVLLIMTALFVGGAEKQYRYIVEALEKDFDVQVLLLNRPTEGDEKKTEDYILEHGDVSFISLNGNAVNDSKKGKIRGRIGKIRALILQWVWLKKHIKTEKPDVAMFTYVTQLLMVPLFKKNGVKTIFNERNTGRQICDKRYKINLLRKCDKVICNSQYASEYVNNRTQINVEVYNNGVELYNIERICHDGYNIVVPARINRIKNQMVVVQAISILKEKLKYEDYNKIFCVFAGLCEDEDYKKDIEKKINSDNLRILIPGYIGDIYGLYGKTDLIILPSYEEGTPNVLLEAYMLKMDAVVSDIPMNRSCATDKNRLFSPDDPCKLAEIIIACMNDKKPKTYYDNNYEFLETNYSLDKMKERYKKLICGI